MKGAGSLHHEPFLRASLLLYVIGFFLEPPCPLRLWSQVRPVGSVPVSPKNLRETAMI